jgi:hypothetical protein
MVAPAENAPTMTLAECGSLLLRLKRAIRHALASRDSWVEQSRVARRALSRLNGAGGAHLIFIRRAIGAVYAEAKQRIREANAVLREGGQHLIRIGDVIDRSTSFAERCMLLGVSPADRHELPSDAGFAAIIGLGFEVSSQYRIYGSERGPLFHAMWPLIVDEMCTSAKGRFFLDAMFVPGRELAEMTRYRREPDGSLVRARPAARVLH